MEIFQRVVGNFPPFCLPAKKLMACMQKAAKLQSCKSGNASAKTRGERVLEPGLAWNGGVLGRYFGLPSMGAGSRLRGTGVPDRLLKG